MSSGCSSSNHNGLSDQFKKYWYQGKAEISRYELEQARYGQIHRGNAVLIFVTEDFLIDKQVKYEQGNFSRIINVLKMNSMRSFITGVYSYSTMISVFTPIEIARWNRTLKVASSIQEWCGQTYTQLNYRKGSYNIDAHSYFQNEADQNYSLKPVLLEDDIWNRIRLNPELLPVGNISMIPGFQYASMEHVPLAVEKAKATLQIIEDPILFGDTMVQYKIEYKDLKRKLTINFEKSFPHMILAWEEEYMSVSGGTKKVMKTRAVKTHTLILDYWNKHSPSDLHYREQLGLRQ
ncbi:MAG: septum formation inhibitor Maf [Chlamydiota bacterium]|nr:septum formation inhibitor Maf [Chlamydiota bacterium]